MGRMRWTAGEQAGTFAEPHWDEMRRAAARREDDSQDKLDPVDLVRRAWSDAESRGEVRWTSPRTIEVVLQSGTTAATDRAQAAMRAAEGEAEHWKRLLLVAGAVTTVLAPDPLYVVGGMVVESYTQGAYVTRAIAFATDLLPERIAARVPDLGFLRLPTGAWLHPHLRVVVDFSARPDPSETSRVVTARLGGVSVRMRALEDTLLDGLQAAARRRHATAEVWVRHMLAAHWDRIGWRLMERQAARAGCAELLGRLKRELGHA